MHTIFAWLMLAVLGLCAFPWSMWLVSRSSLRHERLLPLAVTLGLASGSLTLIMFWMGLAGIRFDIWLISAIYIACMAPGIALWLQDHVALPPTTRRSLLPELTRVEWLMLLSVSGICAAILFNAAYWPFSREDVLGIYGRYGKLMAETGGLVPFAGRDDAFYQAYPMHIPLAYAFAFMVSGWENEYLARVIPALLSLGSLPATFLLARRLSGTRMAGWLAAALLATTPIYVRWASSGYVDLPMAFYFTMAALFGWSLSESDSSTDAALCGAMLGLAAWTKNAGLLVMPMIGVWLVKCAPHREIRLRNLALVFAVALFVAGPWYARNWVEAGLIVPPTAWIEQAERSLRTALTYILQPQDFGLVGPAVTAGVLLAVARLRTDPRQRATRYLLWLTLPFFLVWWLLVSYDPRFLLLFFPLVCALAAGQLYRVWMNPAVRARSSLQTGALVLLIVLTGYAVFTAIEYKDEILRDPFMGDATKREIVLPLSRP